jgi:hypothetical protein
MFRLTALLFTAAFLNGQTAYTISTLAGGMSTLNGYTGDGGPATQARLNRPGGLALGSLPKIRQCALDAPIARMVKKTEVH